MEPKLTAYLIVCATIALLIGLVVFAKSTRKFTRTRKAIGGALLVASTLLGGNSFDPNAGPESDKSGQLKEK